MPNVRAKRGASGRTPGPASRKCTPYLLAGPGGLPLVLRLSEGLGLSLQRFDNGVGLRRLSVILFDHDYSIAVAVLEGFLASFILLAVQYPNDTAAFKLHFEF
jgi:hypothetical protein